MATGSSGTEGGDVPEPGQRERDDAVRRLVDAAIDCIDELGYGRVATAEVALRAGVTQSEQYRAFPTRADLMAAVAAEVLRRWRDAAERPSTESVIDLSGDPCEVWRNAVRPRRNDRLKAESHVWQELVLASYTDSVLNERMADMGIEIAQVALAEMRRLPGADLVPHDVLLGIGVTVIQMRETGRAYLDLNGYEIPGLSEALDLMLDGLCERYGIGERLARRATASEEAASVESYAADAD